MPLGALYLLGASRDYGNMLYRDYVGITFPYILLTTSKFSSFVGGGCPKERWGPYRPQGHVDGSGRRARIQDSTGTVVRNPTVEDEHVVSSASLTGAIVSLVCLVLGNNYNSVTAIV